MTDHRSGSRSVDTPQFGSCATDSTASPEVPLAPVNVAGRTLAELITETESPRIDLPWVGHKPRGWEPEPLRWLAIRASRRIMAKADDIEDRGRPARAALRLSRWLRGG